MQGVCVSRGLATWTTKIGRQANFANKIEIKKQKMDVEVALVLQLHELKPFDDSYRDFALFPSPA